MIYKSIDKRYPYMAMLCELIDKYFVETLLCSGGVKWVLEVYIGGRFDFVCNADCRARIYFNGSFHKTWRNEWGGNLTIDRTELKLIRREES